MKKLLFIALALLVSAHFAAAGQPKLVEASLTPETVDVGGKVEVVVEFTGKIKDIKSVSLIVREYPYDAPVFKLEPCDDCKKNVWKSTTTVPYDAPAQSYHLEIKALDKKGKEIVTKEYKDQWYGRTGVLKVTVN